MTDAIELVIKVDKETLQDIYDSRYVAPHIKEALRNSTPLPKGHGKLIDTNEITAFEGLECNGHNVESLDEFTTIVEADKEVDNYYRGAQEEY